MGENMTMDHQNMQDAFSIQKLTRPNSILHPQKMELSKMMPNQ